MYPKFNQLIEHLNHTANRSVEQEELLKELLQIKQLLSKDVYSLAPPAESLSCPECGYKIYG